MAAFVRTRDSSRCHFQLHLLRRFTLLGSYSTTKEGNAAIYCDSYVLERKVLDSSKWKKVDASRWGVTSTMIPPAPMKILAILRVRGFDSYLVGGCVRDLLLKKEPKDFDIITSAKLSQVKQEFRRSFIIGQRFPICKVLIHGVAVEVSSFETVTRHAEAKEASCKIKLRSDRDKKDFICWRDSMHRDFTVNSLYYDPFKNMIYDYTHGMEDLKSLKLRTLIPAHISFQEDCARILRGLRIAGRLGLTISKDIAIAIHELSSSIENMGKPRMMLEINYMLSYGAAMPTIVLLQKFRLLDKFLPFHAAYLDHQDRTNSLSSCMLMKLLEHLDQHFSCDQPCHSALWVSLLGFHQALAVNPQHGLVIWTFASLLYHGNYTKAIQFVRKNTTKLAAPEISGFEELISDEQLKDSVLNMVHLVQQSVSALTVSEYLTKFMSAFPLSTYPTTVFVPPKLGKMAVQIFDHLLNDTESQVRINFRLNYSLISIGDKRELGFALGKIILETLNCQNTATLYQIFR